MNNRYNNIKLLKDNRSKIWSIRELRLVDEVLLRRVKLTRDELQWSPDEIEIIKSRNMPPTDFNKLLINTKG